jgi:AraC-like DNA-binding protein
MTKNTNLHPCFEKVIIENGKCFKLEEVYGKTLECIYHHHPEFELTCIVNGSGNRLVGTSVEHYRTGDLVLLGGNLPHHYASIKSDNKMDFSLSRVIKFNSECLGKDFFEIEDMTPIKQLLQLSYKGLVFSVSTQNLVNCKITELFKVSGPRRIILFLDILNDLAMAEKRCLTTTKLQVTPNDIETKRMDKALGYISENINQKLTLTQVSRFVSLAPPVFSRFFSKLARMTFSQYVLELRVNSACNQLQETDMSISEICYTVGFSNLSNFNRLFKKVKHMTPREFRNRAKQAITLV